MPHFGLMDATKMTEADAALLRVRLHIRGSRRRFEGGMVADGLAALYDALQYAMRWYIMFPEHRQQLGITGSEDFRDDRDVFNVLAHGGVIDRSFDFDKFESLVERAVNQQPFVCEPVDIMRQIETVMTRLAVMPFDEAALPAENPMVH